MNVPGRYCITIHEFELLANVIARLDVFNFVLSIEIIILLGSFVNI